MAGKSLVSGTADRDYRLTTERTPAGENLAEVGYEEDDYEENPIVWTP